MRYKDDTTQLLENSIHKVEKTLTTLEQTDSFPRNLYADQTEWNLVGIHDWCSGFWPGILWYAYEITEDPQFFENAQLFTSSLYSVLDVPVDNHDLGFMLFSSFGNGYRLTKDPAYKDFLLLAADSLATLYNPTVGTILSWPNMREKMNWPHNTIIDNMINLELLFWAAKHGGRRAYYNMAVRHAEISMTTLVRPDYTINHVAVFDTIDGHFIKGVTHQGYADSSMWARGQGWGIYGYTMTYRETGDQRFLELAQKLADVFMARLPEDGIPYWDFDDPHIPNAPKDASAAAIVASALLELSTFMASPALKDKYVQEAKYLLSSLSSVGYWSGNEKSSMLLHATGHYPNGSEIDASIIYADYYFMEALVRLKKLNATL
ncbi:MAG: glycoside hydrolase family 88 protein [Bacteroidales bacterium]|nr:glycoside hydrolase family 88 protein [Bacteroidales bacterium]